MKRLVAVLFFFACSVSYGQAWRNCVPNSIGPGGCDSIGPEGGQSIGPRGGQSIGPGGGQALDREDKRSGYQHHASLYKRLWQAS